MKVRDGCFFLAVGEVQDPHGQHGPSAVRYRLAGRGAWLPPRVRGRIRLLRGVGPPGEEGSRWRPAVAPGGPAATGR